MYIDPSMQMWMTFAIIAGTVAFYVSERASVEITSIGCIVSLLLLFHFMPLEGSEANARAAFNLNDLLSGFASPALVTILSLLVIGQGLVQTGALESPTRRLQALGASRAGVALVATLVVAGLLSAFLNNTPVVVMFIPIVSAVSAKFGLSPSKTLIPLSFITILGGMTTLIGSSTNVLVAGVAHQYVGMDVGFFDFAVPGALLACVGAAYVIFAVPLLLRPGSTMAAELQGSGGRQFVAQITIGADHPLEGQTAVAGMFPALKDMTVRLIQRGPRAFVPPFEGVKLRPGDLVIVAATRKALTEALTAREGMLTAEATDMEPDAEGNHADQPERLQSGGLTLAEAVVAPGSRIVGRRVDEVGLVTAHNCIIIGVQRRSRMIRMQLNEIRLEAGDVVLVLGTRKHVRSMRLSHDFLLLEWSAAELPDLALAARAQAIFATTVVCVATGLLPIVVAALAGAFAMVPAGCLNLRQAARAFDRKIYLMIGASLAMATSLEATGGATYVASHVVNGLSGASTAALLSGFFLLVAIMTNLLSNHATAALFAPIGINAALSIGVDPSVFVHAVILAANCSFATPMGYQTNMLVMGSGHYKFADFLRTGTPLIILLWIAYSAFAPWYYGL